MVKAVEIAAELAAREMFRGRTPDTPGEALEGTFAELARTAESAVFTGSFQGESAWERHPYGDELVQVLDGATRLSVITPAGKHVLEMTAGMVTMVPRNCWHRFEAPDGVTLMTATPQPTDHWRGEGEP